MTPLLEVKEKTAISSGCCQEWCWQK